MYNISTLIYIHYMWYIFTYKDRKIDIDLYIYIYIYIKFSKKIESQLISIMLGIPYDIWYPKKYFCEYAKRPYSLSVSKEENCYLSVISFPEVLSATVGFLSFPSATANLYNIYKSFNWTHVSINVSKYNIHAGYIVATERD